MMRLAWFVGGSEEQGRGRGGFILPVSGLQHILGLRGGSAGFPKKVAFSCLQEIGHGFLGRGRLTAGGGGAAFAPFSQFCFPP